MISSPRDPPEDARPPITQPATAGMSDPTGPAAPSRALPPHHAGAVGLVLFLLWLALSPMRDAGHLLAGALSAAVVAAVSHRALGVLDRGRGGPASALLQPWWRLVAFLPWLAKEVVVANLKVAALALSPRPALDPVIVRFETRLEKELARATLANAITLTPGTFTVDLEGDEFVVHALQPDMARLLAVGDLQGRVARLFAEGGQEPGVTVSRPGEAP